MIIVGLFVVEALVHRRWASTVTLGLALVAGALPSVHFGYGHPIPAGGRELWLLTFSADRAQADPEQLA